MGTPRFVRPAWLHARADGRSSAVGLGPRSRDGWIEGAFTLRTAEGDVSSPISFYAGGRSGRLEISVPASLVKDVTVNGETVATLERLSKVNA